MRLCHQLLEVHPHQTVHPFESPDLGDRVRAIVDGLDSVTEQKISDNGCPQVGLDGVLRASKQVFDREVLLYDLEARLSIPAMTVDVRYFQRIEFQRVRDVGKELYDLAGLRIAELNKAQVLWVGLLGLVAG